VLNFIGECGEFGRLTVGLEIADDIERGVAKMLDKVRY